MLFMLATAETSHADRSWLNNRAPANTMLMLVTLDTSQEPMGPCGPMEHSPTADRDMHAETAVLSSFIDCGANAAVTATGNSGLAIQYINMT